MGLQVNFSVVNFECIKENKIKTPTGVKLQKYSSDLVVHCFYW